MAIVKLGEGRGNAITCREAMAAKTPAARSAITVTRSDCDSISAVVLTENAIRAGVRGEIG
jgi:hypothetical protein